MVFFRTLKGILAVCLISFNTLLWFPFILLSGLIKFVLPIKQVRSLISNLMAVVSTVWTDINNFNMDWYLGFKIQTDFPEGLTTDGKYLIIANHQSWTDIIILQKLFNRKIPFFRFFLKEELIYIPLLGLAWWALDYPFMKRYSKEKLKNNPELIGKDLEITKKACEKYRGNPVSIVNFVEGTRFKESKRLKQNSPYTNLLRPKAGGISYVLYSMGDDLEKILNVTIVYPVKNPSFWKFLTGRLKKAYVEIEVLEIDKSLIGNYSQDEIFRKNFQNWINSLWNVKDSLITQKRKNI
jgi:1-acyl-sn-glycerol-3-phosphate acyltransferase